MKNRIISISLAVILAFSVLLTFAGCGDNNYPVEVANFVIKSEPENIVVLDPSTADIISYIGYDVKMVGRSDEVNQSFLSIVPSVGSASSPDADEIINSGATVVFAGENLDDTVKQTLQSNDIMVITMSQAETSEQLGTNNCGKSISEQLGVGNDDRSISKQLGVTPGDSSITEQNNKNILTISCSHVRTSVLHYSV